MGKFSWQAMIRFTAPDLPPQQIGFPPREPSIRAEDAASSAGYIVLLCVSKLTARLLPLQLCAARL